MCKDTYIDIDFIYRFYMHVNVLYVLCKLYVLLNVLYACI